MAFQRKGFGYLFGKLEGIQNKDKLKRYYKKLEQEAKFDCPYIYFALAYQPENSTSPLGEVFADQLLIIDMLSYCLPNNWYLYVKEHCSQWHRKLHGERSRTIDFYRYLSSIPNVKIIPVETSNFDLIDNAKAIATVTGTTGWEAVIRGKPALVFGHAWYKDCKGIFYTPSIEKTREAISTITSGYKVDIDLVKLFIYALEKVAIKGYVDVGYKKVADISYEENIAVLTETVNTFFQKITLKKG